jgi:DNA-binding LytR/AlgR family response regulator
MQKIPYPDFWLRLLLIPLFGITYRHMGEMNPLLNLFHDPAYYIDLPAAIATLALFWQLNRAWIVYLDQHYSWLEHPGQRALIQAGAAFLITSLPGLLFIFVYNEYLMKSFRPDYDIGFLFVFDLPVLLLLTSIQHLIYTILWFVHYVQIQPTTNASMPVQNVDISPARKTLMVNQGKSWVPLNVQHVAYIFVSGDSCWVKTIEQNTFRIEGSLEQWVTELPVAEFFRINRQFLAHRQSIRRVQQEGSGRLLLDIHPEFSEQVSVARRRVAEFKNWLEN